MTYETDSDRVARHMINDALNRAPSFVFLNLIFEMSLESHTDSDDERRVIIACAKRQAA